MSVLMLEREPRAAALSWSRSILVLALLLALPASARGEGAYLVRDIDLTREPYYPPCYVLCPPPPAIHGSLVSDLLPFGDRILLVANDRTHGFAPWISDGTAAGTRRLADGPPEANESPTILLGAAGGFALFWPWEANDRLWITDGTESGTEPIDMPCDPDCQAWSDSRGWTVEGQLFFNAYDGGAKHIKLYRFDPAARATHEVFDACADQPSTFCLREVLEMVSWNGEIYFNAIVTGFALSELRLYRMDGPGTTPTPVPNACTWSSSLLPFGSQLLFFGNCGTAGQRALFSLDAPGATPRLLHPFAEAGRLTAWGGDRAAFTAGADLWITDGTAAGTVAAGVQEVAVLAALGDLLLVTGSRQGARGLYAIDRSGQVTLLPSGTIHEGPQAAGALAFFSAESAGLGVELWVTDGTPQGTRPYQDLAPGPASSDPGNGGLEPTGFVAAGDRVYFAASDPQHDTELWAAPLEAEPPPPPACVPGAEVLCLSGRFAVEVSWKDFSGRTGRGRAVPLESVTGAFWFFDSSNLELMVKVLDGRALNGHHWVFYGALSNVEFTLTVTDTATGRPWSHHNPAGRFASGADTSAFPE